MTELSTLINKLLQITTGRRYLEIGVMAGVTFNQIENTEIKVAVDPHFLFDTSKYQTESINFVNQTSDSFFSTNKTLFDVIFLDGLHHFNQTLRDLLEAISLLRDRYSIIIIDDICPTDIYSSIPDQRLCYELRTESFKSNNIPLDWRGDVYKTLLFVSSYLRSWKKIVVVESTGGNHRLVLTRRDAASTLNESDFSLETIERFDYIKFRDFFNKLDTVTIDQLLADLSSRETLIY